MFAAAQSDKGHTSACLLPRICSNTGIGLRIRLQEVELNQSFLFIIFVHVNYLRRNGQILLVLNVRGAG
jgi:hypothetical protein